MNKLPPPFSFVTIDQRRNVDKPRKQGLSMMIDDGLPLAYLGDALELAGSLIDLAKFKTGTSRLYPRALLVEKIALYKSHGIRPFIGGQFHEYVFAEMGESALDKFYEEALRLGFETIEISDNTVPLTPAQREGQIRRAIAAGLEVFGEVGSKETLSNPALLIEQARLCLASGASLVLVEAAELVRDGVAHLPTLEMLKTSLDPSEFMIELPGPWIENVRTCDIEYMKKVVLRAFGPNVNLANIDIRTIFDTEAQRIGLGTAGPLRN